MKHVKGQRAIRGRSRQSGQFTVNELLVIITILFGIFHYKLKEKFGGTFLFWAR